MEFKYHYLYKITNLINNKFYYGIHSTNNLNDGYMGSGKGLHRAYNKYDIENFKKEILEFRNTREEISKLESEIVNFDLISSTNCYNIRLGGDDGKTIGTAMMIDTEGNQKRVVIGSNEHKNMVGLQHGKTTVFDLIDNIYKNITIDEFNLNKDRYKGTWFGRHHTEETKHKLSEHHKITGKQKGEKNSQYGTCWITKDGENKKIKKEELDGYLNDGWVAGRIVYWSCKKKR